MKEAARQIRRLEHQFGAADETQRILLIVSEAAWERVLDPDRRVAILRECAFLPTAPLALLDLRHIPQGLNAEQTERFLRESGAEIWCS
jgi:hypothetical protein